MRILILAVMLMLAYAPAVHAQTGDDFKRKVMATEFDVIKMGTCSRILDTLEKRLTADFAAMACSMSYMARKVDGGFRTRWTIALEFPANYRYILEDPEYIEAVDEWRYFGLKAYNPEWAKPQGLVAIKAVDERRRELGYFEPDEWVIYLKQYWYNRDAPQPHWYTGRKAAGADVVWEMLPDRSKQVRQLKAQNTGGE